MKPLLAKEIRLVLPAYAMALVLAAAPLWLVHVSNPYNPQPEISVYPLFFGALMLALSVFGREFGLKTFPLLLAQPLERKGIWLTKIAVLAGAMASLYVTWYLALLVFCREWRDRSDWLQVPAVGGLMLAIAFSGGLWTTLLLRQVVAAFWFTLGVPMAILTIIGLSGGNGWIAFIALGLYSVAGFWMAWRLFFRAQEAAWTGGVITFPGWRSADAASQSSLRTYRPLAALLGQELQLHQVGLAGMGCLFVLHLGVVALRKSGQDALGDTMHSVLEFFGGIWLIVPLIIGSSSVAEERKLGVLEEHLCRPISRRVQFAIKLFFVLVLGGMLSAVLFWTAEGVGSVVGAAGYMGPIRMSFDSPTVAWLSAIFLALALIGFYASTLARNIVQALAVAVVATIAVWMLVLILSDPAMVFGHRLWQGILGNCIAWPTLAVTFILLAYRNFRFVSENSRLWRRNVLGLVAALVFIFGVTSALYHRAWEWVTPLEPAPGPARLVGAKPTILCSHGGSGLTVLMPDGRLWVNRIAYDPGRLFLTLGESTRIRWGGKWIGLDKHPFMAGSNWVAGVATFCDTVAIRTDGTLWVSEKPRQPWDGNSKPPEDAPAGLVQFGDETNWQTLVLDYNLSVVLLKRDGTLWRWGTAGFPGNKAWPGLRAYQPHRLGTESDWTKIMPTGAGSYAWKKDGRAWVFHRWVQPRNKKEVAVVEMGRLLGFDHVEWRSLTHSWPFDMGVRDDGTLWAWTITRSADSQVDGGLAVRMKQIGKETNWVIVTANTHIHGVVAAVKADGTLWKWERGNDLFTMDELTIQSPVRLGTRKDWIAVGSAMYETVSLAADGSLWFWSRRESYYYGSVDQPLLAASRKPIKIENILGAQD